MFVRALETKSALWWKRTRKRHGNLITYSAEHEDWILRIFLLHKNVFLFWDWKVCVAKRTLGKCTIGGTTGKMVRCCVHGILKVHHRDHLLQKKYLYSLKFKGIHSCYIVLYFIFYFYYFLGALPRGVRPSSGCMSGCVHCPWVYSSAWAARKN